jgi:hypothetical protein
MHDRRDRELMALMLTRLARDIAARLGHDPDEESVDAALREAMADAHEFLVIAQCERDMERGSS